MPGFDQRGPLGQGPMTGRRLGRCTNFGANLNNPTNDSAQNDMNQNLSNAPGQGFGFGRGLGRGRGGGGRGMGWRNRFGGRF